jgi:hypothetical protein
MSNKQKSTDKAAAEPQYRQFTDDERAMAHKNLANVKSDLEFTRAQIKQTKLGIEVAPVLYDHQLKEMASRLEQYKQLEEQAVFVITETEKQLKQGVLVK